MITVDPASPLAPFEQIRLQISDAVRSGELAAGARLPSIRQLAADLRVAAGTVAKAYAVLEEQGMLETSRARGTRVAAGQQQSHAVRAAAEVFVAASRDLTLDQALSAVRAAWSAR